MMDARRETLDRRPSSRRKPSHRIPFALCGIFFGFVCASHQFAVFKAQQLRDSPLDLTLISNLRLEKCLRLVDSVQLHWWWGAGYAVLFCVLIGFSVFRKHPRWSTWTLFSLLAFPWFYYIYACVYVAGSAARI